MSLHWKQLKNETENLVNLFLVCECRNKYQKWSSPGKTTIKIVVQTFSMVIIWGSFGLFFELALLEDWVTNFLVRVVICFYWYNHMVNREYLLNKVGTYILPCESWTYTDNVCSYFNVQRCLCKPTRTDRRGLRVLSLKASILCLPHPRRPRGSQSGRDKKKGREN